MLKLLKYEFSSSVHRVGFLVMAACVIVATLILWSNPYSISRLEQEIKQNGFALISVSYGWEASDDVKDLPIEEQTEAFYNYYMELQINKNFHREFWFMLTTFIPAYIVGMSFSRRTANLAIQQGHPRWKILIAKLIFFYFVVFLVLAILLLQYLIGAFQFRWLSLLPQYLLRNILIWFYLNIAATSLSFLIAFICRKLLATALVNFALFFGVFALSFVGSTNGYAADALLEGGVLDFYPATMLRKDILWAADFSLSQADMAALIVFPALVCLACGFCAYLFFRRAELK